MDESNGNNLSNLYLVLILIFVGPSNNVNNNDKERWSKRTSRRASRTHTHSNEANYDNQEIDDLKKLLYLNNNEKNSIKQQLNTILNESEKYRMDNLRLKLELAESKSREQYLELQLQQVLFHDDIAEKQIMQSMRDMIKISTIIQSGRDLPVSD